MNSFEIIQLMQMLTVIQVCLIVYNQLLKKYQLRQ